MEDAIFTLMTKFLEKQDTLYHLSRTDLLAGHGITELHVLQRIGKTESITVTELAKALRLTKGAVSKTIKKLTEQGYIRSYMREGNRQKIYYHLTDTGQYAFILEPIKKHHKLFIAPKARWVLHETGQRA